MSFIPVYVGLGDLGVVDTPGVASTLDTSSLGASDITYYEIKDLARLVAVILSINSSRTTGETFSHDRNCFQNAQLMGNRQ